MGSKSRIKKECKKRSILKTKCNKIHINNFDIYYRILVKVRLIKQEDTTNHGLMDCLKMLEAIIKEMISNQVIYTVYIPMESGQIQI